MLDAEKLQEMKDKNISYFTLGLCLGIVLNQKK